MESKKIHTKSGYVSEIIKRKDNYIAEIDGMSYWSKKDILNLKGCQVELTYVTSGVGDSIYNWIQNVLNFENGSVSKADSKNTTETNVAATVYNTPRVSEDKYSDNKTLNTCLMVAGEVTKIAYCNPDSVPSETPLNYCVNAFKQLLRATKDV